MLLIWGATSLRQVSEEVSLPGTSKKVLANCFHHSECYLTGESLGETQNFRVHCSARDTSRLGVTMQTGDTSTFAATSGKRTTVFLLPALHHRGTQDHSLWLSTIKLRLVGSRSWNGGTPAPLEQTRQRNIPMKGLANSLPNVAALSRAGDQQLMANWCSSCFPSAQRVPARMLVLHSSSYNALNQTPNKCCSQIIWHSWGTARCADLPSRCSKNILTAVSARKTVWWCFCCFDIHSSARPRLHTQLNCSVLTHTGRLFLATRLMLKIKPMQNKQKTSLLNP